MTVADLIEELLDLDPHKDVVVGNWVDWTDEFFLREFSDYVEITIETTLVEED